MMTRFRRAQFLRGCWWVFALFLLPRLTFADLQPYGLNCEHARNPRGVDLSNPRLSWKLASETRGSAQSAWHILAASAPEILARDEGDLWDSGKVVSAEQTFLPYAGKPLQSLQAVFWKVRVWNRQDVVSDWSAPAQFTMGLLSANDWRAKWIQSPETNQTLLLRREFVIRSKFKRAIAVVCGLGQYELSLNGRRSGDDLLTPGWTKYDKTCLYDTHDVTTLLRAGTNAIALELGGGMYRVTGGRYVKFKGSFGPLKAIAQLRIEYSDGAADEIVTDEHWRVAPGPITFSCVYGGEDHDARLEPRGWTEPHFEDAGWHPAQVTSGPGGALLGVSASAPPVRVIETITPASSRSISNGITFYDIGQNASLMPRIKVRGPAGSRVRIVPAELLRANGTVDRTSVALGGPAWWQYTLRGGERSEVWFPKFFYHGARYLQMELQPAEFDGALPEVESIEGVVVHSAAEPAGEFECSSELFNRIRKLVRWAQRSNMASVLTDCPHRERLGWLEQYHLNGPSIRYEFDLDQLFAKGMNDMVDCQLANGCVPSIAPEYTIFGKGADDVSNAFRNSPEWGSAIVLVPWQQYQFTGDAGLLRLHYDAMKRYVAYLRSTATNHIVNFGLGDWYDIGPNAPGFSQLTPVGLTATAIYFEDNRTMACVAELLGKADDAAFFRAEAEGIRAAFNRKFFDDEKGVYATGSQCANAMPLVLNLVEPQNRASVLEALVQDIRTRTNSVTAGDVGYRYVLRALADEGRSDVIFEMNNQTARPGYGFQLAAGATSLTEAWNARRSSSQNHFMLGQIIEWFYRDLAGIAPDPQNPGFKNVLMRPQPVGDITWVRASYNSVRGKITSSWKRDGKRFRLEISIPPNCTANVSMPGTSARLVAPARSGELVRDIGTSGVEFQVSSGDFVFESHLR